MQQNFNALFPNFTDQSRLWMYLSDRPFSNDEVSSIAQELNKFMLSWSAHNKKLKSSGGILFNQIYNLFQVLLKIIDISIFKMRNRINNEFNNASINVNKIYILYLF